MAPGWTGSGVQSSASATTCAASAPTVVACAAARAVGTEEARMFHDAQAPGAEAVQEMLVNESTNWIVSAPSLRAS